MAPTLELKHGIILLNGNLNFQILGNKLTISVDRRQSRSTLSELSRLQGTRARVVALQETTKGWGRLLGQDMKFHYRMAISRKYKQQALPEGLSRRVRIDKSLILNIKVGRTRYTSRTYVRRGQKRSIEDTRIQY